MFWSQFRISGWFVLSCIIYSHSATAQSAVESELMQRITRSKNELQDIQKKLSSESRTLAQRLEQKEHEVKALRVQAAAQQRIADEQLLSLDKLKERVDQWETQSGYQTHLLRHYQDTIGISLGDHDQDILQRIVERTESALNPAWSPIQVISADGKMVAAAVLKLGPVEVALDEHNRVAGPLVRENGVEARVLDIFDKTTQQEVQTLRASGVGLYPFDPTLGNALQLRNHGEGPLEHLRKGGLWAIPIVFFGILSLPITLLKANQLLRLPSVDRNLPERLQEAAQQSHSAHDLKTKTEKAIATVGPAQRKLAQIAINNPVSQQRDDLLVAYLMEVKHLLEKYMGVVATSAAIAPLLGLLGTVSGMIDTFKMMTIFGSGDASTVSGGISEALITTELGLIVAIPSLIVSALLARRIKSYIHKLENFAIKLSKLPLNERTTE